MRKQFMFYHKDTGLLHSMCVACYDVGYEQRFAEQNAPADHLPIEGRYDHLSQRVDVATSKVVDYQPPQPSADHEWDAETKRWRLSAARSASDADKLAKRQLLAQLRDRSADLMRAVALSKPGALAALQDLDAQITELEAKV